MALLKMNCHMASEAIILQENFKSTAILEVIVRICLLLTTIKQELFCFFKFLKTLCKKYISLHAKMQIYLYNNAEGHFKIAIIRQKYQHMKRISKNGRLSNHFLRLVLKVI